MLAFRPLRRMPFMAPVKIMRPFRQLVFRRLQSTLSGSAKKPSGLKALMKEYGYAGLGVYLLLTAVDLPICYVVVHSAGKEQIEVYENKVKQAFGYGKTEEELLKAQEINRINEEILAAAEVHVDPKDETWLHYLYSQFSWTEFALAYGIHKSLIFIRVPITAAITPGIVKALRGWGFRIGSDKLSKSAALAKDTLKDYSASSPKFGVPASSRKRWFSWFF